MAVNSAGFQIVGDGGIPQTITGYALEVISGGDIVMTSGVDTVSSGGDSFISSDLVFNTDASGATVIGVAGYNVESGALLQVYTKGDILMRCSANTAASVEVECDGANGVETATDALQSFGRALIGGTSGNYALVHVNV